MSESKTFCCPACKQRFDWKPQYQGRKVACKCGHAFVPSPEPAEDEADVYDLTDGPPATAPSPARPSPAVTASVGVPAAPVLAYERKDVSQTRRSWRELFEGLEWHNLLTPVALVVIGLAVHASRNLFASSTGNARLVGAMLLVAFVLLMDVTVMLSGLMIAARFLGTNFGAWPTVVLKLCITAVITCPVGAFLASMDKMDGSGGMIVALHAVIILTWFLFYACFRLDMQEIMVTVVIITFLQIGAFLVLWKV